MIFFLVFSIILIMGESIFVGSNEFDCPGKEAQQLDKAVLDRGGMMKGQSLPHGIHQG